MNIQILDEDGENVMVIQDSELGAVLHYAERWLGISNDATENEKVHKTIISIREFLHEQLVRLQETVTEIDREARAHIIEVAQRKSVESED